MFWRSNEEGFYDPNAAWRMEDPYLWYEGPDYYRDDPVEMQRYMAKNYPEAFWGGIFYGAAFSLIGTVITGLVGAGFALAELIRYYRRDKKKEEKVA